MDTIKNLIYAGVGLASLAADKVKTVVDELVNKGKISDEEGKRIVKEFFENTDSKKDEWESKFKSAAETVIEKFEFVRKKDFKLLVERVEELEAELAKAKPAPEKVTTKKVAKKDDEAAV